MHLHHLILSFFSLSLITAAHIKRQTPAATSIYTFPGNGAWVSGSTTLSNGSLLLTRLDVPELWTFNPSTKTATKLLTFPGFASATGIVEVSPSIYLTVTGNFNTSALSFTPGSWGVWRVDLSGATPDASLFTVAPSSDYWLGITKVNNDTVLIAESGKGAIIQMEIATGAFSTLITDPSMKAPATALIQEGIHGIKYRDGWVYFSNTFGGTFNKLKVDAETVNVTGEVVPILTGLNGPEDFVFGSDGTAFVPELPGGDVFKVTSDGQETKIATAGTASTVSLGVTAKDNNTLYISTGGGAVFSVQV